MDSSFKDLLQNKDYPAFQEALQKLTPNQITEVYKSLRLDSKVQNNWEIYNIFLISGYDISLVHDKTFFQDCKRALLRSWLFKGSIFITNFLCKLLRQGYLMSDDDFSEVDSFQMLELAIKYTRPSDLKEILNCYPKVPDSKLLFLAIDYPLMVTPLLEVFPSIDFVNESGETLLIYAIKKLNSLGQRKDTELPPLMDREELIEYLQMTEDDQESFEDREEGEDVLDRLRVIHTIKEFMDKF